MSVIGMVSISLLLGLGMDGSVMAESFPLKIVSDSIAPDGKVFVSVDFNDDGVCDEQAVLISISTAEKIGIESKCVLSGI
ncbi:hypothetical protein [Nitrosopumilus sp. S6]